MRFSAPTLAGTGIAVVRRYEESFDPRPAHHVLNTVLRPQGDDTVRAWSRFLLSHLDGSVQTGDLVDELVRTPAGWRVAARRVTERNRADGGAGAPAEDHRSALEDPR